jgi:hypothetical protein
MLPGVSSVEDCLHRCIEEPSCKIYTYFGPTDPLSHVCILFTNCVLHHECTDCVTGIARNCTVCSFEDTLPDGSCLQDGDSGH